MAIIVTNNVGWLITVLIIFKILGTSKVIIRKILQKIKYLMLINIKMLIIISTTITTSTTTIELELNVFWKTQLPLNVWSITKAQLKEACQVHNKIPNIWTLR